MSLLTEKSDILQSFEKTCRNLHLKENPSTEIITKFDDSFRFYERITDNINLGFSTLPMFIQFKWSSFHGLNQIYLEISTAGRYFLFNFEPKKEFIFLFDGKDCYGQDVFSQIWANIKIGYKFKGCSQILWTFKRVKMTGETKKDECCGPFRFNVDHVFNPLQSKCDTLKVETKFLQTFCSLAMELLLILIVF